MIFTTTVFVGTYASAGGEKVVYRVKKPGAHGGYAIVTETASEANNVAIFHFEPLSFCLVTSHISSVVKHINHRSDGF